MPNRWAYIGLTVGRRWHGDDARKRSAALLDGHPTLGLLMHGTAEHRPAAGLAPVRWLGARRGFALLAFGAAIEPACAAAGALASAWCVADDVAVLQEIRHGTCTVERTAWPQRYRVPRVIVQKKPWHRLDFARDPAGHVRDVLHRGLSRHARLLGLEPPEGAIEVLGWSGATAVPLGHGSAALMTLRDVEFRIPVRLSGWWGAGYLQARGYGQMNADLARAEAGRAVA